MCQRIPTHVLENSISCVGEFQLMCWIIPTHVLENSNSCVGEYQLMCWIIPTHVLDNSNSCVGEFQLMCWRIPTQTGKPEKEEINVYRIVVDDGFPIRPEEEGWPDTHSLPPGLNTDMPPSSTLLPGPGRLSLPPKMSCKYIIIMVETWELNSARPPQPIFNILFYILQEAYAQLHIGIKGK